MKTEHTEGIVSYALLQSKRMSLFVGYTLLINLSSPEVSFRTTKVDVGAFYLKGTIRTSFHSHLTDSHQSDSQQSSPSPFVSRISLR
jgi:hypothetical protein